MTVAKQVKEFGAKVNKDGLGGYYIYTGKNFTVKFNSEECVTKYWEVNLYDNCPLEIEQQLDGYNKFDTKNELVFELLSIDKKY